MPFYVPSSLSSVFISSVSITVTGFSTSAVMLEWRQMQCIRISEAMGLSIFHQEKLDITRLDETESFVRKIENYHEINFFLPVIEFMDGCL